MKFVPMCSSRCGMLCSLWLHERPGAAAISSWAAKVQAPGFGSHKDFHGFPVVEVVRSCFCPFVCLQVNMSESFVLTCFLHFLLLFFCTWDGGPCWTLIHVFGRLPAGGAGGAGAGGAAGGSFHSSSWHSSGGSFHSGGSYHTHVIHHYHWEHWASLVPRLQWLHLTSFDPFSAHCTLKHGATWSHMEPHGTTRLLAWLSEASLSSSHRCHGGENGQVKYFPQYFWGSEACSQLLVAGFCGEKFPQYADGMISPSVGELWRTHQAVNVVSFVCKSSLNGAWLLIGLALVGNVMLKDAFFKCVHGSKEVQGFARLGGFAKLQGRRNFCRSLRLCSTSVGDDCTVCTRLLKSLQDLDHGSLCEISCSIFPCSNMF